MLTLQIDVTLLDKARFKEVTRKNGKVAKFCELVLIETPNSKFGDYIVKQGVTKEERAARIEMPIIGNGKNFAPRNDARPAATRPAPATSEPEGDVPF